MSCVKRLLPFEVFRFCNEKLAHLCFSLYTTTSVTCACHWMMITEFEIFPSNNRLITYVFYRRCDRQGYDRLGFHCQTGYNRTGYDKYGRFDGRYNFGVDGLNSSGLSRDGRNRIIIRQSSKQLRLIVQVQFCVFENNFAAIFSAWLIVLKY